jgi:hypothetical protein
LETGRSISTAAAINGTGSRPVSATRPAKTDIVQGMLPATHSAT